jgi:hypothetical protein
VPKDLRIFHLAKWPQIIETNVAGIAINQIKAWFPTRKKETIPSRRLHTARDDALVFFGFVS